MQSSRILARIIWIHNKPAEDEDPKEDLLGKLSVKMTTAPKLQALTGHG